MKKHLLLTLAFLMAGTIAIYAQNNLDGDVHSHAYAYVPWLVLLAYIIMTLSMVPKSVSPTQFFKGNAASGANPNLFLLVTSAAITWIFGKSIANASNLANSYGVTGGLGYALYYLSFITAGVTIYFIRIRGNHTSITSFLISKYGKTATKIFLYTIAFRLFNEVWSNTKVAALYFGQEGSIHYWIAVILVTGFTIYYSWKGGLRSSLLTDALQMVFAAILLSVVIFMITPPLLAHPAVVSTGKITTDAGWTFCALALVQIFSYPFHDPVLTDRAFITEPKTMLKGFILAGIVSGSFIFLYSLVGLFARNMGISGDPVIAVPAYFGLPALIIFNAIMLTSSGSTIDSTFTSVSKLAARDWNGVPEEENRQQMQKGRWFIVLIAILGNLPLFTIYMGDKIGPAIIAATTISGTMVMGLAPIFMLSFLRGAGKLSFHLAFWPGVFFGLVTAIESFFHLHVIPDMLHLGSGAFAADLGINLYGLLICCIGFMIGVFLTNYKKRKAVYVLPKQRNAKIFGIIILALFLIKGTSFAQTNDSLSTKKTAIQKSPDYKLSGGIYLFDYAPTLPGTHNNFDVYAYVLKLDAMTKNKLYGLHVETRMRDTKLRPFYNSTLWFQQAYAIAKTKMGELHIGKVYRKVGLFWDDSFFGNIQYFNGLKLNPDYGAEWIGEMGKNQRVSMKYSLQFFNNNDHVDGAINGRDVESDTLASMKNTVTARFVPKIQLSKNLFLKIGVSGLYGQIKRTVGNSFIMKQLAGDATINYKGFSVFGEILTLQGEANDSLHPLTRLGYANANYLLAGVKLKLFKKLTLRTSYSFVQYTGNKVKEWELLPGISFDVNNHLTLIAEYNNWQTQSLNGITDKIDNSYNFVIHYHF